MEYKHIDNCVLFEFFPNELCCYGFFDETWDTIFIDSRLSKSGRELVYHHEKQHKTCCNLKCFCWSQNTDFWTEYHAFKAELDFALSSGIRIRKIYLKDTYEYLNLLKKGKQNKDRKAHYLALKRVCKLKRFIKLAKEFK